eukprot:15365773-Ditylum_brightwellii.AAC.2
MEVVEETDENEDLEEEEEDIIPLTQNRRNVTVASMIAVKEESKNDVHDDTADCDKITTPTVEIKAESKGSKSSNYECTAEAGVHDDDDYVPDEDASHPSYAEWQP